MKITEIRNQSLSSIIAIYFICKECGVVDRDRERMKVGRPCPRCGLPNDAARMYFPASIDSVIDLIQEFYHTRSRESHEPVHSRDNHHLAVVIFFCTLFDMLLEHFLRQKMISAKLPFEVQDRLLEDSRYSPQRTERLFPTLTASDWTSSVSLLSSRVELDYEASVEFYRRVRSIRNRVIHEGAQWIVPEEMPTHCVEQLHPLVSLFVALHNEYCVTLPPKA